MDTVKKIDLTRLCIQINKKEGFFLQIIYTSNYKEIQNKIHVNTKPKVLSNTMFRHSHGFGLWTFIVDHALSDWATWSIIRHQNCFSLLTYNVRWYNFKNILIFIYINDENENRVKMAERGYEITRLPFYSL